MKSEHVRIALVGVRNHGATILHAIRHSRNLDLACCYDVDRGALLPVCNDHGIPAADSYESILTNPGIDAVALVTPNHLHHEQAMQAFGHGKHVFVEKPITNTIAEAEACIGAARDMGMVLMVGHNTRRRAAFRDGKRILDEGRLGRIVSVDANLSRHAGLEPGAPRWKMDPRMCTLLPMTQLGIHFVDVTEYFFGEIEEVVCHGWNAAVPAGVIDSTIAVMRGTSVPPTIISSFYTAQDTFFYRVFGTDGTMTIRAESLAISSGGVETVVDFSNEGYGSFIAQMEEFGDCIRHGKEPETSGTVGLRSLRVIEAMRASIEQGYSVSVGGLL